MSTSAATRKRRERLTVAEAADRLGISPRHLRRLTAENRDVPSVGRGVRRRYLWPDLRSWRDRQLVQQGVESVRSETLDDARARKAAADASMRELDLGERRGALMPADRFAQEFEAACSRVAAHMLNAPGRYAPQLLAAFPDRLRADDLIKAEEFIRRMMHDQMAELEAGDDVPDDEEAAAAPAVPGRDRSA